MYLSSSRHELEQSHYVGQLSTPYVSPALGPLSSLSFLPPLLVQSAGLECLRDEISVFVRRARKAGTDVTHQQWNDGIHVFQALQPTISGASAMLQVTAWFERNFPARGAQGAGAPDWTKQVDALLRAERDARLARAGPIPPAPPASTKWTYVRSVERLPRIEVKKGGHEAARRAADEAEEVEGEMALTEVFRPKKVGGGWFW